MKTWIDKNVEFLKENYTKMTARELSEIMGISRDAIIGKANRMGLGFTIKPEEREPVLKRKTVARARKATEVTSKGNKFYMEELEAGMCRYPYGSGTPYLFCGEPCKGAYCPRHHKLCHVEKVEKGE